MTPTRTLIRAVMGSARTPASASASVRSTRRSRARPRASAPRRQRRVADEVEHVEQAGPGLLGPEPQPLEQVRMPGLGRADASTRPFPRQGQEPPHALRQALVHQLGVPGGERPLEAVQVGEQPQIPALEGAAVDPQLAALAQAVEHGLHGREPVRDPPAAAQPQHRSTGRTGLQVGPRGPHGRVRGDRPGSAHRHASTLKDRGCRNEVSPRQARGGLPRLGRPADIARSVPVRRPAAPSPPGACRRASLYTVRGPRGSGRGREHSVRDGSALPVRA